MSSFMFKDYIPENMLSILIKGTRDLETNIQVTTGVNWIQ